MVRAFALPVMVKCRHRLCLAAAMLLAVTLCCVAVFLLVGCSGGQSVQQSSQSGAASTTSSFAIEGKWKNVGDDGFGQAQPGSIVVFDGTNCNFFSPSDTYAFYWDNDHYVLDATSVGFSETLTFPVEIIDEDNITVSYGDTEVSLRRVG